MIRDAFGRIRVQDAKGVRVLDDENQINDIAAQDYESDCGEEE